MNARSLSEWSVKALANLYDASQNPSESNKRSLSPKQPCPVGVDEEDSFSTAQSIPGATAEVTSGRAGDFLQNRQKYPPYYILFYKGHYITDRYNLYSQFG